MKTRHGFVSNSSTSSFVCVVKPQSETPIGYFNIIEILKIISKQYNILNLKAGQIEFEENKSSALPSLKIYLLDEYNSIIKREIQHSKDKIKILKSQIKAANLLLDGPDEVINAAIVYNKDHQGWLSSKDEIVRETKRRKVQLEKLSAELKQKKVILSKLAAAQEDSSVIEYECDHWNECEIEEFLQRANVSIVEKVRT